MADKVVQTLFDIVFSPKKTIKKFSVSFDIKEYLEILKNSFEIETTEIIPLIICVNGLVKIVKKKLEHISDIQESSYKIIRASIPVLSQKPVLISHKAQANDTETQKSNTKKIKISFEKPSIPSKKNLSFDWKKSSGLEELSPFLQKNLSDLVSIQSLDLSNLSPPNKVPIDLFSPQEKENSLHSGEDLTINRSGYKDFPYYPNPGENPISEAVRLQERDPEIKGARQLQIQDIYKERTEADSAHNYSNDDENEMDAFEETNHDLELSSFNRNPQKQGLNITEEDFAKWLRNRRRAPKPLEEKEDIETLVSSKTIKARLKQKELFKRTLGTESASAFSESVAFGEEADESSKHKELSQLLGIEKESEESLSFAKDLKGLEGMADVLMTALKFLNSEREKKEKKEKLMKMAAIEIEKSNESGITGFGELEGDDVSKLGLGDNLEDEEDIHGAYQEDEYQNQDDDNEQGIIAYDLEEMYGDEKGYRGERGLKKQDKVRKLLILFKEMEKEEVEVKQTSFYGQIYVKEKDGGKE